MANEDLHLFKRMLTRLDSSKQREIDEDDHMCLAETANNLDNNLFQRYNRVNLNTLDYQNSLHSMALQDSGYVQIENNRERIQK